MLFTTIIPYTGPWGYRPGRGSGREPPPRQREPYWPSYKAPAQERGFSGQEPGKGAAGEIALIIRFVSISPYTALLSPTPPAPSALLPRPGGGSSRDIPGKAGLGRQPRSRPSPASSHTPDRGDIARGGAGEGTLSPAKRTIPALHRAPAQERGFSWQEPGKGAVRKASPCIILPSPPSYEDQSQCRQ